MIQKKDDKEVNIPESYYGKKKTEDRKTLIVKKDGSFLWNNEVINIEDLKKIIDKNSNIIINIDEKTSIQNLNKIIKVFKLKKIKKIFINVKHKNDKI